MQFDGYAFADYCGAVRDSKVVLAVARGGGRARIVPGVRTRRGVLEAFHRLLDEATARRERLLFGLDHQYSVPLALAEELGLDTRDWRTAMRALFVVGPLGRHALEGRAGDFARAANARLSRPYFWSATKDYGIPHRPPRARADPTVRRLAEIGFACAFDRVGDNGTVGGQTIVGIPRLLELAGRTDVRVWPFDGLHLGALGRAHVAVEPYPSLVRELGVVKSDANDALACVLWAQRMDREGALEDVLDLRGVDARVRFEGWIAGRCPRTLSSNPRLGAGARLGTRLTSSPHPDPLPKGEGTRR